MLRSKLNASARLRPRFYRRQILTGAVALVALGLWHSEAGADEPDMRVMANHSFIREQEAVVSKVPSVNITMTPVRLPGESEGLPNPRGGCPPVMLTDSSANFSGGSFVIEGGFVAGEIAAVSFQVPANAFPITFRTAEMIFAANRCTVTTTTQWSLLIWSGVPSDSNFPVETFMSDGSIIPHIVMPPNSQPQGVNCTLTVDTGDPDQVVIQDNGSHTISIGYRVDVHNQPAATACCSGLIPQPCCPPGDPPCDGHTVGNNNAFPTVDANGRQFGSTNYLRCHDNCGQFACTGGWHTTTNVQIGGDWNIRLTYEPFECSVGACCSPNGTCNVLDVAACALPNTYQGNGTSCTPNNPCAQPLGACCNGAGGCTMTSQANCPGGPGNWLGDGVNCSSSPCTGACCTPGGCVQLSAAACTAQSGTFQGTFASCSPDPCSGACCTPSGCAVLTPSQCAAQNGQFATLGSNCTNASICNGACCPTTGGCAQATWQACTTFGGEYAGRGVACAAGNACPKYACCLASGLCVLTTQLGCANQSGVFHVNQTCQTFSCPQPLGACCAAGGGCVDAIDQATCQLFGGAWQGVNTTCAANPCTPACNPPDADGDVNTDGLRNGKDAGAFVQALLGTPAQSEVCHGDFNGNHMLDSGDVNGLVNALLAG